MKINGLHSIQFTEPTKIWHILAKIIKNIPKLTPISTAKRTQKGQKTSLQVHGIYPSNFMKIESPCKK